MSDIVRFSVSVEADLLEKFDRYCREEQLATRSEAVRQLIHDRLTTRAWERGTHEVAGTLTLVYDHHRTQLGDRLAQLQHDHTDLIVATTHVHLTHDVCLEVIILRGPAERLQQIAAQLKGMKGIFKGELVMVDAPTKA
ncbi:MAG: nickel-responsive transcriptional regulator NikR [Planctomycetota bacterium]|nr:nickel-responsive transcriptional regulator NikR [Planctomycetota bacterium]